MRVSLGKSFKVNMGNYESLEISAHVTLDETDFVDGELDDFSTPDERMEFLRTQAMRYMNDYLEPELRSAAELSQADRTMLTPPPAPRRERSTRRRSTT